jgi:23S rRNA (uracil1939-C5)-methyltransferase
VTSIKNSEGSEELFSFEVESLSNQAEGVARAEGKVVFIPCALPGERVRARIVETRKDYDRAVPEKVTRKAETRVDPPCPYYGDCGGCQLEHLEYGASLEAKRNWLAETLLKIGKIEWSLPPAISSEPYHYRSKCRFFYTGRFDRPLGLRKALSPDDVVPVDNCLLCRPRIAYAFSELSRQIGESAAKGAELRFSAVTLQEASDGVSVILELAGRQPETETWRLLLSRVPEIRHASIIDEVRKGKIHVETLMGEDSWVYRMGRFDVPASPGTFHQVNPVVGEKLYDLILTWVGEKKRRAVEAYCGTGSLAIALGGIFRQVRAADRDKGAIKLAKRYADERAVKNVTFAARSAEDFLFSHAVTNKRPDLLILDPPRAGCSPRVLQGISILKPRHLVLVSCHPAAFARDLSRMRSSGYNILKIQALDMFPQTFHMEAAALLALTG